MGIVYTQETTWTDETPTVVVWTDEDPTIIVWTDEDPTAVSWFDECRWKSFEYSDADQQFGDDSGDEVLEKETYDP